MNSSTLSSSELRPGRPGRQSTGRTERIWPLDLAIVALAGIVLYLIASRLAFNDPRWLYNSWTYVVAIPVAAILLSILSRFILSRFVRKSLQLGLISSVFVHVLLLVLAVNVVIFQNYFPDALTGVKQDRHPIHQTLPEYVFQASVQTPTTPDWSKPTDAETASRVVPTETRKVPPLDSSSPKLEIPQVQQTEPIQIEPTLVKRETPVESMPEPADSPGHRASQRRTEVAKSTPWTPEEPIAPIVQTDSPESDAVSDRLSGPTGTARQSDSAGSVAGTMPADLPNEKTDKSASQIKRIHQPQVPDVSSMQAERRIRQAISRSIQAAGSSPSTAGVVLPKRRNATETVTENIETATTRNARPEGASLAMQERTDVSLATDDSISITSLSPQLRASQNTLDSPSVDVSRGPQRPATRLGTSTRSTLSMRTFEPAGAPDESAGQAVTNNVNEQINRQSMERVADSIARRRGQNREVSVANNPSGPELDLPLEAGPAGIASAMNRRAGILMGDSVPKISAFELHPRVKRRRDLGGPVAPAGTKIASTESFNRRMMRTDGAAGPTPSGAVGPATEKAIEKGLAYLASIQNDDGSWSLQGQGSDVVLQSDTAATGLCLLAFQGAGYTHQQHEYADTINRGIGFLTDNQLTNGNLYRSENRISNENVALYSHGIASLALCEAFGMTQDAKLRDPAQESIRYIVETQHRRRGGWRYTPQVSSDTSVTGWMMMALKSGDLSGLDVRKDTYNGIERWLGLAQSEDRTDRYRYNPFAPDTPTQRHGRVPTPTMTAVGMLMRMYMGWSRDDESMQSAADYLLRYPPQMGTRTSPQRDGYYWYYATMVMFHMGGDHWREWNSYLKPVLLDSQVADGDMAGSWDPIEPVPDRWSPHAGRIYVTTMNLLNLEVYYRHLPIYDDSAD